MKALATGLFLLISACEVNDDQFCDRGSPLSWGHDADAMHTAAERVEAAGFTVYGTQWAAQTPRFEVLADADAVYEGMGRTSDPNWSMATTRHCTSSTLIWVREGHEDDGVSLTHELVHWMLKQATGDSDTHHARAEIWAGIE